MRSREFALLVYLLRHPRQALPRARILEEVWGADFDGTDSVLDVSIRYLRAKTEADGEPHASPRVQPAARRAVRAVPIGAGSCALPGTVSVSLLPALDVLSVQDRCVDGDIELDKGP